MAVLTRRDAQPLVIMNAGFAQAPSPRGITLYEDVKTGALYRKPGKGRVAVTLGFDEPSPPPAAVQKQVEEVKKNNEELRAEFVANQQALIKENTDLKQRVAKIEPAWNDYLDNFRNRFRIGTADLWRVQNVHPYGLWARSNSITISGRAPAIIFTTPSISIARISTSISNPDPRLDRAGDSRCLQDLWDRDADRQQPQLIGKQQPHRRFGLSDQVRLDPVQSSVWIGLSDATKGDVLQFGAIPNPMIPWEEHLTTFRYVTASPWNYLGLSSAQFGLSIRRPDQVPRAAICRLRRRRLHQREIQSVRAKQHQAGDGRLSVYPFGSKWDTQGLGLTGFYDYGYNNTPARQRFTQYRLRTQSVRFRACRQCASRSMGRDDSLHRRTMGDRRSSMTRDITRFPARNLFTGNGPSVFFTPPAAASPAGGTSNPYSVPYYNFSAMTAALLGNSRTVQQGFDVFGHLHIPETPFRLIGLFQWFEPNSKVNRDPLDFYRYMVGVEWQINEFMRLAIDTQNLDFYHDQEPFSTAYANSFANVFLPIKNTSASGRKPNFPPPKTIADPVPRDTHAVELNLEFAF